MKCINYYQQHLCVCVCTVWILDVLSTQKANASNALTFVKSICHSPRTFSLSVFFPIRTNSFYYTTNYNVYFINWINLIYFSYSSSFNNFTNIANFRGACANMCIYFWYVFYHHFTKSYAYLSLLAWETHFRSLFIIQIKYKLIE